MDCVRISGSQDIGFCGDCYCIPDIDNNEECPPKNSMPETNFTSLIPALEMFELSNPSFLSCNPYDDNNNTSSCDIEPTPLEAGGGACVIELEPPSNATTLVEDDDTCPTNYTYSLRTYIGTYEDAIKENLLVTHAGSCGLCSSLQDLVVYMEQGGALQDEATNCGIIGRNGGNAIECFTNLGFTIGCATIWTYNTINTNNECLQCDEDKSGPIFQLYAGRTRRNSGLLSGIVRPCSSLIPIQHINPCLFTTSSADIPSTGTLSYLVGVLSLLVVFLGSNP